jgi:hypothetical protein
MIIKKGFRENSVVCDLLKLLQNSLTFCLWIQITEMKLEEYKATYLSFNFDLQLCLYSLALHISRERGELVSMDMLDPQTNPLMFLFSLR